MDLLGQLMSGISRSTPSRTMGADWNKLSSSRPQIDDRRGTAQSFTPQTPQDKRRQMIQLQQQMKLGAPMGPPIEHGEQDMVGKLEDNGLYPTKIPQRYQPSPVDALRRLLGF